MQERHCASQVDWHPGCSLSAPWLIADFLSFSCITTIALPAGRCERLVSGLFICRMIFCAIYLPSCGVFSRRSHAEGEMEAPFSCLYYTHFHTPCSMIHTPGLFGLRLSECILFGQYMQRHIERVKFEFWPMGIAQRCRCKNVTFSCRLETSLRDDRLIMLVVGLASTYLYSVLPASPAFGRSDWNETAFRARSMYSDMVLASDTHHKDCVDVILLMIRAQRGQTRVSNQPGGTWPGSFNRVRFDDLVPGNS